MLKIMTSHHQWKSVLEIFYEAIMAWEKIWKYFSLGDEQLQFLSLHSVPWISCIVFLELNFCVYILRSLIFYVPIVDEKTFFFALC